MAEHPSAVMHSGSSMMILCREHERSVALAKAVNNEAGADHVLLALGVLDIFYQNQPVSK